MPELTDEHKKNLAAWVADLRSGGPQVKGRLCGVTADGEVVGHCCLGRLQDLAMREWGVVTDVEIRETNYDEDNGDYYFERVYSGLTSFTGHDVNEKIGYVESVIVDPKDGYGSRAIAFTTLNDDFGWSFERIADAIEAQYLK